MKKENPPQGFTLLDDALAKELNEVCPAHKVIIDSWLELMMAAQTVARAAETYWQLTAGYHDAINNRPDVKPLAQQFNMEIHQMVKDEYARAQRLATMCALMGIALEKGEKGKQTP